MTMASYAAIGLGAANLIGGIVSSKSAKKLQKEALALQRRQLDFAMQRYNEHKATYGDLEKQVVADAQKGVQADLGGVTSRATGDVASAFANAEAERQRNMQRLGIAPDSGRADAMANQTAIQKALTQAGNVTTQREQERRRAEDQTWDRRQFATRLGVSQMNGDAADIASATQNMANTTSNYANQDAAAAGNFFAGAGQALGTGLALHKPSASSGTVTPTGGVPMAQQYVTPSDAYAKKQMAVKNSNLITDLQSGNNPTLAAFNLGVQQQKKPNIPIMF